MTVWLCQCLCPDRHCIVAAAEEAETEAEATQTINKALRRQVAEMIETGAIDPACALCGANRATWRKSCRWRHRRPAAEQISAPAW